VIDRYVEGVTITADLDDMDDLVAANGLDVETLADLAHGPVELAVLQLLEGLSRRGAVGRAA